MRSASSPLPIAFCFAGQGSQYYHMAADLMDAYPVFRQWMEVGDKIVRNGFDFSPLEKIYDPARRLSDPFDHLEHSHPALFMTQFALAKLLQSNGIRPDLLLGVSLGEFVAMSVSGMLPFETALKAVASQPATFRKQAPAGALIAVLASKEIILGSDRLRDLVEVAGTNADNHSVIACLETNLEAVLEELRHLDKAFQRLPVPFAFHSRWIDGAKQDYLQANAGLTFEMPFWPVWSAHLGHQLGPVGNTVLWDIVRGPMHLQTTVRTIEDQGGATYIDLSPTGSLAAVLRQELGPDEKTQAGRQSTSRISALLSPFGGDLKRLDAFFTQKT